VIQEKRNHNICDVRLDYGAEVLEDAEIKELVRYIHLNPLRARVVSDISGFNRYAYCGHSVLMGERECTWQDTRYVLDYFGKKINNARKGYFSHVKESFLLLGGS